MTAALGGIINRSSDRFDEFLRFYEADGLDTIERSAMAGLVLASANERLVEVHADSPEQLVALLPRIVRDASWELDYWRGLDPSRFPLGGWLRRHC